MKWLPKLMGFDYKILYKNGSENWVADALSRVSTSSQLLQMVLTTVTFYLLPKIMDSWKKDSVLQDLILKQDVKTFVALYEVCQRNKSDLAADPGLLQPLPIPNLIWTDISMDFIEGLPLSPGKSAILVVVDRLTKYSHFIALSHPFTATQVANAFIDHVYKLHGLPKTIVSDRDKVFLSLF
ncbi:retrotransposable element Tf2 [Tanacetum coccineum]